ncbi:MAG: VOC family protein, partial [Burkholderiales bacterium]
MSKTKRKLKGTSRGRKATRVARKAQKVSWLAKGYPVLSSVAVLDNCPRAIEWYKEVLGAKQRLRLDMPGGRVAHCELGFGDAVLMIGSPMPPQFPPRKASLAIYVKDCDATYNQAL